MRKQVETIQRFLSNCADSGQDVHSENLAILQILETWKRLLGDLPELESYEINSTYTCTDCGRETPKNEPCCHGLD